MRFVEPIGETPPIFDTFHLEAVSPDGKDLAWVTVQNGQGEIYVRAFDGSAGRWQISNEGGSSPIWKKSDEILYQSDRKILSVRVRTLPIFSADPPRVVIEGPYALADAMPDGDRLLTFVSEKTQHRESPLRLVLNWFPEVIEKMAK